MEKAAQLFAKMAVEKSGGSASAAAPASAEAKEVVPASVLEFGEDGSNNARVRMLKQKGFDVDSWVYCTGSTAVHQSQYKIMSFKEDGKVVLKAINRDLQLGTETTVEFDAFMKKYSPAKTKQDCLSNYLAAAAHKNPELSRNSAKGDVFKAIELLEKKYGSVYFVFVKRSRSKEIHQNGHSLGINGHPPKPATPLEFFHVWAPWGISGHLPKPATFLFYFFKMVIFQTGHPS